MLNKNIYFMFLLSIYLMPIKLNSADTNYEECLDLFIRRIASKHAQGVRLTSAEEQIMRKIKPIKKEAKEERDVMQLRQSSY